MGDIQRMIHGSIAEAFAVRDGRAEENRTLYTGPVHPLSSAIFTPTLATPQHVLSRWPRVPEGTIKSIALGAFDIDNMPKLHRSDELRNAYLKRSLKGI
jgi:hypothetical protein